MHSGNEYANYNLQPPEEKRKNNNIIAMINRNTIFRYAIAIQLLFSFNARSAFIADDNDYYVAARHYYSNGFYDKAKEILNEMRSGV